MIFFRASRKDGKIINLAMTNSAEHWADSVESHLYNEKEIDTTYDAGDTAPGQGYNIAKPWIVIFYQLGYILGSPIIGKLKDVILSCWPFLHGRATLHHNCVIIPCWPSLHSRASLHHNGVRNTSLFKRMIIV